MLIRFVHRQSFVHVGVSAMEEISPFLIEMFEITARDRATIGAHKFADANPRMFVSKPQMASMVVNLMLRDGKPLYRLECIFDSEVRARPSDWQSTDNAESSAQELGAEVLSPSIAGTPALLSAETVR